MPAPDEVSAMGAFAAPIAQARRLEVPQSTAIQVAGSVIAYPSALSGHPR